MSPVASPVGSPISSPSSTPQRSDPPDAHVASAILASLNASAPRFMQVEELISRMEASRGEDPSDDASAAGEAATAQEGTEQNPIVLDGNTDSDTDAEQLDEEESEQFYLNRSVQRAYERFLQQLNISSETLASASSTRGRRPQHLTVITNRRPGVVIRLPNGGSTFVPQDSGNMHIISPRRRRRSERGRLPSSSRPLVRQFVTLRNTTRHSAARGRLLRYSHHLTNQNTASSPMASRRVSGFRLTESMGVPEDKCSICLEQYKVDDVVSYVACQPSGSGGKDHMFHQACIESWVESLSNGGSRERTCPVCRGVF